MGKYIADVKRIASIYPGKLPRLPMNHGPSQRRSDGTTTWYELEPISKERATARGACVIEIYDSFEHSKDELKSAANGYTVYQIFPIASEDIVNYLLLQWTGNLVDFPAGAMPGVMEIVHSVPTQDELQQMKEQQMAYMEYCFMEGERLAKDGGDVRRIPPRCAMAADYLGRPRGWSHPSETTNTIKCPLCRTDIPEDSYVCQNCGKNIRALPEEFKQLNEEPISA